MIQVNNIDFLYQGAKHMVFNNFSLTLKENNIYGLLGKNGTGKSTLLYLISGLLRQKSGSILVDGIDSRDHNPEILKEIFFVPEEFTLPSLSLEQYIRTNASFYPNFSRDTLMECLKDFELSADLNLKELSMGQKKKVFMSFALATNTRYLFMDEPTNGLDIPSKSQFRKVIARNMNEDRTLIVSTHQVHDVEQLLDHLLILDHSHLLLDASVADICDQYTFEYRPMGSPMDDVIYSEPSLQGNAVIAKKTDSDKETTLNLELLFDAVTTGAIK